MFFVGSSRERFFRNYGLIGFSKIIDFGFELHSQFEDFDRGVFVLVV